MLQFMLGSMFGGTVGVVAMCLCTASKFGDEYMNNKNIDN